MKKLLNKITKTSILEMLNGIGNLILYIYFLIKIQKKIKEKQ